MQPPLASAGLRLAPAGPIIPWAQIAAGVAPHLPPSGGGGISRIWLTNNGDVSVNIAPAGTPTVLQRSTVSIDASQVGRSYLWRMEATIVNGGAPAEMNMYLVPHLLVAGDPVPNRLIDPGDYQMDDSIRSHEESRNWYCSFPLLMVPGKMGPTLPVGDTEFCFCVEQSDPVYTDNVCLRASLTIIELTGDPLTSYFFPSPNTNPFGT